MSKQKLLQILQKFGMNKTKDKVMVELRKLLKQRSQLIARGQLLEAHKKKMLSVEQLREERKKAARTRQKRFDPHDIFYFTYKNPVTKPHIWDIRPLVIMLGITSGKSGNALLAVNLHWLPPKYRDTFWKYIRVTYEDLKEKGKEKEVPLVVYQELKNKSALQPALSAIRKYILTRIGKVVRVPESDYDKIFMKYKSLKKQTKEPKKMIMPADDLWRFIDKRISNLKNNKGVLK
jgi:hypothetical protein